MQLKISSFRRTWKILVSLSNTLHTKKGKILKRKYRISYKSCGDIIGVFILRFDFSGTFLRWNNQCCHFCELYCWQKFVTVLPPGTGWNSTNVQIFVTYVCVYKISSCQFQKCVQLWHLRGYGIKINNVLFIF